MESILAKTSSLTSKVSLPVMFQLVWSLLKLMVFKDGEILSDPPILKKLRKKSQIPSALFLELMELKMQFMEVIQFNPLKENVDFFFGGDADSRAMKTTAVLNNCSLCIIKPHIIRDGQLGQVIDMILQAGFEISACEMFNLSRSTIEEFYSVYKGVLPEYLPVIEAFSNGACVALEIR